jgi:hypothetical protein
MFLHLLLCCDIKLASVLSIPTPPWTSIPMPPWTSIPMPPWTTYIVFFWVQDILAMKTVTFVLNVGNHQLDYTIIT